MGKTIKLISADDHIGRKFARGPNPEFYGVESYQCNLLAGGEKKKKEYLVNFMGNGEKNKENGFSVELNLLNLWAKRPLQRLNKWTIIS